MVNKDDVNKALELFRKDMVAAGLRPKTIKDHLDRISFFFEPYLFNHAEKGITFANSPAEVPLFLGDFFIYKCAWSSPQHIQANATSFKKFYKLMYERGLVEENAYQFFLESIKEKLPLWKQMCEDYNEGVGDVWDDILDEDFDENFIGDVEEHFNKKLEQLEAAMRELQEEKTEKRREEEERRVRSLEAFERFNPAKDVQRCPRGKAKLRDLLDEYAEAATALSGCVPISDFLPFFKHYTDEEVSREEFYLLNLPLIRKKQYYAFYQDYIVHGSLIEDEDAILYFIKVQEGKPLFYPPKNEVLLYRKYDLLYFNPALAPLHDYIFELSANMAEQTNVYPFLRELHDSISVGMEMGSLEHLMDMVPPGLFKSFEDAEKFIQLFQEAQNQQRRWSNRGHTPIEIFEVEMERRKDESGEPSFNTYEPTIGRNDPCYCGSGLKYKKCCGDHRRDRQGTLTTEDSVFFFMIWNSLLFYVNEKEGMLFPQLRDIKDVPNLPDPDRYRLREILFANPHYFDECADFLDGEAREICLSWKNALMLKNAIFIRQEDDHAFLMAADRQGFQKIFAVKGLTHNLMNIVKRQLPVMLTIRLLPFREHFVYDTFVQSIPIQFGPGAQKAFEDEFKSLLRKGSVVTGI